MITVEELIINSLYHRLVLITVRRSSPAAAGSNAGNQQSDRGEGGSAGAENQAGGGTASGAVSLRNASTQECYSDTVVIAPAYATLDDSDGDGVRYASSQGLGYLYLGQLLPQLKAGMTIHGDHSSASDPSNALLRSINSHGEVGADQRISVTKNVRTILEEGDTRLMQAMLQTGGDGSGGGAVEQMWSFASLADSPQRELTGEELKLFSSPTTLTNPLIDLRSCDQFSIVRLEDTRDPSNPALTMIHTNGHDGGKMNGQQMFVGSPEDEVDRDQTLVPGFSERARAVGQQGALFVEDASNRLVKRDLYPVEPSLSKSGMKGLSTGSGQDVDSGIWDMMHQLEASSSSSSPFLHGGNQMFLPGENLSPSHVNLFRTRDNSSSGQYPSDMHRSPSDELQGTYRMYEMPDSLGSSGGAVVNGTDARSGPPSRRANGSTGVARRCGTSSDGGGLSDALQPAAVVQFVVHRIEAPVVRMETITAVDSPRKHSSSSSSASSPFNRSSVKSRVTHLTNGVGLNSSHAADDSDRDGSTTNSRISKLCSDIQNLTESEQATLSDLCSQIQALRSQRVPTATEDGVGSDDEESGDAAARWNSASRGGTEAYRDIVEITSVRGVGSVKSRVASSRESRSDSRTRRCRSERSSPHVMRGGECFTQSGAILSSRSACASPTRLSFAIDSPDTVVNGNANVYSRNRARSGGSVGGYSPRAMGYLYEGTSTTTVDSGEGHYFLDDGEVIEFERYSDWMSELPESLHSVPLSALCIPGSHICVAVERDMRVDMDFSRCNYEMAEFLRKLPNLAVFNGFRAQMKAIWKAWMPKQCLSLHQQLEAGARYLDMRVTKYLSAFYGEHGLYTRQLKKYLKEVRLFMAEHPREVIVLHFELSDYLDRGDKRRLVTVLFQIFGAKMACYPGNTRDTVPPTLQWMWANGKQLIVYFPSDEMSVVKNHIFGGLVWSDDSVDSLCLRRQSVSELVASLDESYPVQRESASESTSSRRLHVTKAVLSPDMSMVFGKFDYRSMRELAERETCSALGAWLEGKRGFNIVALDFIGLGGVVKAVLDMNKPLETII